MRYQVLLTLPLLGCTRCEGDREFSSVEPTEMALTGYERLSIDTREPGLSAVDVDEVRVAGILAYDLVPDGFQITVTVQGAPEAGWSLVSLSSGEDSYILSDRLTYDPPLDPLFDRVVVLGASLGMGVQSGVPVDHGQLHGPAMVLARQLGAWVPPPLLVPDLFRGVEPSDIGPAPDCALPDTTALAASAASESLALMRDPETNEFGFQFGRVDPDIEIRNLSVGGSSVCDVVHGPGDFGELFLSHLVYDPYGELGDEVDSQIAVAQALAPTALVSFDLIDNDLIDMVLGDDLDPSLATPEDEFTACLDEFLAFADTGAEIWVANAPDVNALPAAQQLAARLVADDTHSTDEVATLQAKIRDTVLRYDQILADHAAAYPNVHVVDVYSRVDEVRADGLEVGDQTLHIGMLGGLLSLDGIHFSDTGYAMLADLFVDAIDDDLGLAVPGVDLEAVLAEDPYSPDALAADGLEPGSCE